MLSDKEKEEIAKGYGVEVKNLEFWEGRHGYEVVVRGGQLKETCKKLNIAKEKQAYNQFWRNL